MGAALASRDYGKKDGFGIDRLRCRASLCSRIAALNLSSLAPDAGLLVHIERAGAVACGHLHIPSIPSPGLAKLTARLTSLWALEIESRLVSLHQGDYQGGAYLDLGNLSKEHLIMNHRKQTYKYVVVQPLVRGCTG